jgi:Flp pilus assembly protein TadG
MSRHHLAPRFYRWLSETHGSSAVEFALILPVMTVLLFGFFEVGRAFYTYSVASSSVRDAARFAARLSVGCGGLSNLATDGPRIQKLARTGRVDGTSGLVSGWNNDASVAVSVSCVANTESGTPPSRPYLGRYATVDQVPVVQVVATVPFSPLFASLIGVRLNSMQVTNRQVWTE